MSEVPHDRESYEHLCKTVKSDENLRIVHYGEETKNDDSEMGTFSPFARIKNATTHYYTFDEQVYPKVEKTLQVGTQKVEDSDEVMTYDLNHKSHILSGFNISSTFPSVRARKGYRVKWCNQPASRLIKYGQFSHNKTVIQSFDPLTEDINTSFPKFGEDSESILTDLGNVPSMQNFSTYISQHRTVFTPSLEFNSPETSKGFPLYLCANADDIKVTTVSEKNFMKLLIVAKEIVNSDKSISLEVISQKEGEHYADFFENGKQVTEFSMPFCTANYIWLNKDECEGVWCKEDSVEPESFYVTQTFPFETKNPSKNEVASISNINISNPVTKIGWVATQESSKKYNIHSNYTSNSSSEFSASTTPISETTINNGDCYLAHKMSYIQSTKTSPRFSTRKSAIIPGIHFRSFGVRANDSSLKPGFLFSKGNMDFTIKENCHQVLNGERQENDDFYNVSVRMFSRLRFKFETYCDSEKSRLTKDKTVLVIA